MDFKDIITKNKTKLASATNCNEALLDSLSEASILHDSEVSDLRAKTSDYARASYLWDLLKQKQVTEEVLIKIFEDLKQGVASLLTKLLSENSGVVNESKENDVVDVKPNTSNSESSSNLQVSPDIKHDIFRKLKPRLITEMLTASTNSVIIEELSSLLTVFDEVDLDPIREGSHDSERSRMNQLLNLIGKKSSEEIFCCLQKLRNMKEIPRKSEKFINIIEDVSPGLLRR